MDANKLLHHALQEKSKGIYYAKGAMNFESAILLSINDASRAASVEAISDGVVALRDQEPGDRDAKEGALHEGNGSQRQWTPHAVLGSPTAEA